MVPITDETPPMLPVEAAASRTGLAPELLHNLARFDPIVEDRAPVRSEVGRSGDIRVNVVDCYAIAGSLTDSGLTL